MHPLEDGFRAEENLCRIADEINAEDYRGCYESRETEKILGRRYRDRSPRSLRPMFPYRRQPQ